MKANIFILILCTLIFSVSVGFSQTAMLSNQGALISVKGGAFIAVHGDAMNERNGLFHNSDTIHLFGDWKNNAGNEAFSSIGEGVVTLRGNNQTVSGTDISRFYDLRLENSGVKFGSGIDIYIDGFLRLNDRELNMDSNVVHVFNPNPSAVQSGLNSNFGFVSASENGGLLRHTNSNAEYAYYLGSTLGTTRFRPLQIRPETASANAYRARFANTDPNNEGLDRAQKDFEICNINPNFYHRVAQTVGNSAAFIDFFINTATDGNYNGIGHWSALAWREEVSAAAGSNNYGLDRLNSDSAVSNFSPYPFALVNLSPEILLASDANPICSNVSINFEAQGPYTTFNFIVDSLLQQSSNTNIYETQLTAGMHPVWVTGSDGICGRSSDTLFIEVLQAPTSSISNDTVIVEGSAANLLASGGDFYEWTPAIDLSCALCPNTSASPLVSTTYTVSVENIEGCSVTDTVLVEVKSDAGQLLFIPNVLTPNNDGYNDTWKIDNIQLFPSNSVIIVNRWGDVVFRSNNYNNEFDGNFSGGLLPSGTYYYILDLGQGWGIFKGDVTIIRK
jgi:gliding motility-associated-like protein